MRIFMASQSRGFRNILIALPDGRPRTEQVRLHLRLSGTAWRPRSRAAAGHGDRAREAASACRPERVQGAWAVRVALAAAGGLAWRGEVPHSLEALLAVLAAAFLHASWNAIAKGRAGRHPLAGLFLIAVGATATAVPLLAVTGLPAPASWGYLAGSAVVHVAYFGMIALAYRLADYSAVYPLIRGGAPLMTSVLAALWLGEVLSGPAVGGVVLLSAGIVGLSSDALKRGHLDRRSLGTAALTAGVVVAYTLLDGLGARLSGDAAAYLLAMMALTGCFVVPLFLLDRVAHALAALRTSWPQGFSEARWRTCSMARRSGP